MKPATEETRLVIVATGRTYPIRAKLAALGFKWDRVQKVWYHPGGLPTEHLEFLTELRDANPRLGISFRHFEVTDNNWNEIQR